MGAKGGGGEITGSSGKHLRRIEPALESTQKPVTKTNIFVLNQDEKFPLVDPN